MNTCETFEELINKFVDFQTLTRSKSISETRIKILQFEQDKGIIRAQIQGNELIPYKIDINLLRLSEKKDHDVIYHDCPDYLLRKESNHKFCRHLTKFFYLLYEKAPSFAVEVLKQFCDNLSNKENEQREKLFDINKFVNKEIKNKLNFEYKGFDNFFLLLNLDNTTKNQIANVLRETKRFPASMRGFHGSYEGGLFDHILLTTNYVYQTYITLADKTDLNQALLAAIFHDFGKISQYALKKKGYGCKIRISLEDLDQIHREIDQKYRYKGRDHHVERAIATVKKYIDNSRNLLDDKVYKAIIFHHGNWSKYRPAQMSELTTIVHMADMIASHIFYI